MNREHTQSEEILTGFLFYCVVGIVSIVVYFALKYLRSITLLPMLENSVLMLAGVLVSLVIVIVFKLTGKAILHKYPNLLNK